jgi:uncharacterized membrane protein YphA (DoxX/SURF4 family)
MLTIFPQLMDYQYIAPTILRVGVATVLLAHGLPKLSETRALFTEWLKSLGIKNAKFWAWSVALAESIGGGLIFFGFLTQIAVVVLIIEFLFIIFWVRRGQPFMATAEAPGLSWEFDFLILAGLMALLVLPPGAYALDLPL